jgi:hypothetical protein
MSLHYQDVATTDALRKVVVHLSDIGTAVAATDQDVRIVRGLNDSGGTILAAYARAGTTPTGVGDALTYDVHKNGTTVFTSTKIAFPATAGGSASTTGGALTAAGAKVYNGDLLTLDCDTIGTSDAGANVGIAVEIRVDEPND